MIPVWIKIVYAVFVAILVPLYWLEYGPQNFLWGSDIALFATLLAVWIESRLLVSMMAVAVLLPELLWIVDYFGRLIGGPEALPGLGTRYMFNPEISILVRVLSLFHLVLPGLLIWLVHRLGYHRRALAYQTALAWLLLPVTYLVTEPSANVNWVYGLGREPQTWMPPLLYLACLMIFVPVFVYTPTHLLLGKLFARPSN